MKKITLLFTLLLGVISLSNAQITLQVLSHPNEFTVDAADAAVFGPSVGEQPLVIRISNIPDETLTTNSAPAPIRLASNVQTALGTVTIPASGDFSGLLGGNTFNPGGTNYGFTNLHQVQINNPSSVGSNFIKTSNGDGTFNVVLIHTRFTQAVAYVEGTDYIVVQRSFLAAVEPSALPVKSDGGSGYVIAPMKYVAASTIETEAELLAKASLTLSNSKFSKSKLTSAFYSASKRAIVINDNIQGKFSIYNLLGQSVLKGTLAKQINVETLKSGLYILSTESGSLKFVKE